MRYLITATIIHFISLLVLMTNTITFEMYGLNSVIILTKQLIYIGFGYNIILIGISIISLTILLGKLRFK